MKRTSPEVDGRTENSRSMFLRKTKPERLVDLIDLIENLTAWDFAIIWGGCEKLMMVIYIGNQACQNKRESYTRERDTIELKGKEVVRKKS